MDDVMVRFDSKLYKGEEWAGDLDKQTIPLHIAARNLAKLTKAFGRPEAISGGKSEAKFWFHYEGDHNLLVRVHGASLSQLRDVARAMNIAP